jgi:hypothetical protein
LKGLLEGGSIGHSRLGHVGAASTPAASSGSDFLDQIPRVQPLGFHQVRRHGDQEGRLPLQFGRQNHHARGIQLVPHMVAQLHETVFVLGDNQGGDPLDTLLRNWTDNSAIVDAPVLTTNYVMDVRCSTADTCVGSTSLLVPVNCPSSGNLGFPTVTAPDKTTMLWGNLLAHNWAKGDLAQVGSYITSGDGVGNATSYDISTDDPLAGQGLYYLFRIAGTVGSGGSGFCNDPGVTWGNASRDAALP